MNVAGLFAGIGGLELGFAKAGHHAILLCENWGPARAVLDQRFPDVPKHADVRELSGLPADTEVLTAGFPCQDLSQAGRTAGIAGGRSGLIGEVFRLLRQRRVPFVILENVPFMLQLDRGRALAQIVGELESLRLQMGVQGAEHARLRTPPKAGEGFPRRRARCRPRGHPLVGRHGAPCHAYPFGHPRTRFLLDGRHERIGLGQGRHSDPQERLDGRYLRRRRPSFCQAAR